MPLTAEESRAIDDIARSGHDSPSYAEARTRAVDAHRRVIGEPGYLDSPQGRFMSEIDNPCPDLMLRARYRQELITR